MPKFVFDLEAVLRQRERAEQESQRELAVLQAEMARMQAELLTLNEAVRAAAEDLKANHLTGKLNMGVLAVHQRYEVAVRRKAREVVQAIAPLRSRLDAARESLGEASKQRRVVEKLRERHHERWKADISRRELAEMNEIGTQSALRQAREAGGERSGSASP